MDPTFIPAWRKQSATPQWTFQTAINVFVAGKRRICCQNSFAVTTPSSLFHTISGAESLIFGFPSRNLPFSVFIGAKRNRGPPKQIFWEIWKWCERLVTGWLKERQTQKVHPSLSGCIRARPLESRQLLIKIGRGEMPGGMNSDCGQLTTYQ